MTIQDLLPWERELLANPGETINDLGPGVAGQVGAYDINDQVVPIAGRFLGYVGTVDELDLADDDKPFRVRFDRVAGEPIAWFGANDLMPAGGAR